MSEKLSFDEIVKSCPLESLPLPGEKKSQIEINENTQISVDEQRREIARLARLISRGHAGYDLWDKDTTQKFEKAIEDFYNGISEPQKLGNNKEKGFYNQLDKVLQILPDSHLKVSYGEGNLIARESNTVSVGENSCPIRPQTEEEKAKNKAPRKEPWSIVPSKDGKSVVLAISDLGTVNPEDWLKLQKETKEALFNKDGTEKYDSLIIDVRGNPGGPSIPYELIGKMLYGNEVAPFEKNAYRDTPENDYLRCVNGEISKEEFTRRSKEHKYTGKLVTVCDYTGHEEEFPPFVNGGFKKPITLITDRQTASAGETLCQVLKGHPGLTIAGENTSGCYAENSGDVARNEFGYGVKIGTSHVFVKEGHSCETKGFAVDFETKGQDALTAVQQNLDKINATAQKRLDAYTPPANAPAKNRDDRLAFNDMMFVREINKGDLSLDKIETFYKSMYPDSYNSGKFEKIKEGASKGQIQKSLQTMLKEKQAETGSQQPSLQKEIAAKGQKTFTVSQRHADKGGRS